MTRFGIEVHEKGWSERSTGLFGTSFELQGSGKNFEERVRQGCEGRVRGERFRGESGDWVLGLKEPV